MDISEKALLVPPPSQLSRSRDLNVQIDQSICDPMQASWVSGPSSMTVAGPRSRHWQVRLTSLQMTSRQGKKGDIVIIIMIMEGLSCVNLRYVL